MEQRIMNLEGLKKAIKDLNYVVMRNWDKFPPHGDIDFFVHPDNVCALATLCKEYLGDSRWFDIRTIGDNYFPRDIENLLLNRHEWYDGWKIPSLGAHFVSLYYHGKVHKGDSRYEKKLDETFFKLFPPVVPADEGVGYHDTSSH